MSRNSKFSAEDKLRIINEMKNIDVDMVAKSKHTITIRDDN